MSRGWSDRDQTIIGLDRRNRGFQCSSLSQSQSQLAIDDRHSMVDGDGERQRIFGDAYSL